MESSETTEGNSEWVKYAKAAAAGAILLGGAELMSPFIIPVLGYVVPTLRTTSGTMKAVKWAAYAGPAGAAAIPLIGLAAGALVPSAMSFFGIVIPGVGTMHAPGGVAATLQHLSAVFTTGTAAATGGVCSAVAGAAASFGIGAAAAPAACVSTAAALGAAAGAATTAAWSRVSGDSESKRSQVML